MRHHIVFQLRNKRLDPSSSNLRVVDRLNPEEMRPVTDNGNCSYPAWSRTNIPDQGDIDDPPAPDNCSGRSDGNSGGGGGCFIGLTH